MIFAEVHGKLGQHHSRAHERAEDLLTSTVFGLLRYLPLQAWLSALAGRVRPIEEKRGPRFPADASWLDTSAVVRCKLDLWRSRRPHGEPDVLLSLYDDKEQLRHLLLIEVKLYSPKSGTAKVVKSTADADEEAEEQIVEEEEQLADIDKDQLVRYWRYLRDELAEEQAKRAGPPASTPPICASLVYLTAHVTPPADELLVSLKAAGSDMRLGWLSWFDVWQVVHQIAAQEQSLPAQDLEALLSHKGFRCFVGFGGTATGASAWIQSSPRFWRNRRWFGQQQAVPAGRAKFWKSAG